MYNSIQNKEYIWA